MFDPSGQLRWIPNDKIDSAAKANAQPAVLVTDPTGTRRWIPHSAVPQAIAHKGKMVSPADTAAAVQQWNDSQEPSAASRLVSSVEAPIVSTAKSLLDWAPTPEEKEEGFTRPG